MKERQCKYLANTQTAQYANVYLYELTSDSYNPKHPVNLIIKQKWHWVQNHL